MSGKIGELLLSDKRISEEQFQEAIEDQKRSGGRLAGILTGLGPGCGT